MKLKNTKNDSELLEPMTKHRKKLFRGLQAAKMYVGVEGWAKGSSDSVKY